MWYLGRNHLKWILLAVGALVGVLSLAYTHMLSVNLEAREQKLIALFAKAQRLLTDVTAIERQMALQAYIDQLVDSLENQKLAHPKMLNLAKQIDSAFSVEPESEGIALLFNEISTSNDFIPVILADENNEGMISRNVDLPNNLSPDELKNMLNKRIKQMAKNYQPIVIQGPGFKRFIYYDNSELLYRLRWFPYMQLGIIALLVLWGYYIVSSSRRAEQNRVWVGMARETAHQLGTPIMSLMAWVEYLKMDENQYSTIISEIEKDIRKLEVVASRFSKIGSKPDLEPTDVVQVLRGVVEYLRPRITNRITITLATDFEGGLMVLMSQPLFEWAVENIIRNAVDAIGASSGNIDVLVENKNVVATISISDSGKGMTRKQAKKVFEPGFTTKQRGWGLGLALTKRIIKEYHRGQIQVVRSEINKGTTFLIQIPTL